MMIKTNNQWGGEYSSPVCETIMVQMETTIMSGEGVWGEGIGEENGQGDF